ncbi:hypothetical protein CBR_g3681 [Chara braunii]|uniref:TOD1/MUCI70 glycosyltransferase-like domain-containing protein n=1 Tax=Chara braunii TaxID=69332 RepID=A0A388KFZ7_CHABU|nr:hypothetical protein CBR_g3681 [Chara braunii]|eukprot:GBG68982.1 hypothetical protein CBR_g3681 [Chara braunii]
MDGDHTGDLRPHKAQRFVWPNSGFDIHEEDKKDMHNCAGLVVASAIFGSYDLLQQPLQVGEVARRDACFYMFVDEATLKDLAEKIKEDGHNAPGHRRMKVGIWRIVLVKNLPYEDPRRNGKIPKLLLHRLFPNMRFSLWIDAKLQLLIDPFQVLERFLWRYDYPFAISNHYRRFDVFVEAEANKAAGKYDNASIDRQMEAYRSDGMTPYSDAKFPIVSDVPEGCVLIREHLPLTNLFGCLWFNEVDRFTSRDQLSFGYTRDRMSVPLDVNMFMDCERRNIVVQIYHKDLLLQRAAEEAIAQQALKNRDPLGAGVDGVGQTREQTLLKAVVDEKGERGGGDREKEDSVALEDAIDNVVLRNPQLQRKRRRSPQQHRKRRRHEAKHSMLYLIDVKAESVRGLACTCSGVFPISPR